MKITHKWHFYRFCDVAFTIQASRYTDPALLISLTAKLKRLAIANPRPFNRLWMLRDVASLEVRHFMTGLRMPEQTQMFFR